MALMSVTTGMNMRVEK